MKYADLRKIAEATAKYREDHKTNADRIRAMSDEELAEFISNEHYTPLCPTPDCEATWEDCKDCWLYWLRQEATDVK